ncbi:hypothetical protein NP493_1006g00008 [Ridgeia piscesae]|uniref:Uncharacterized protein n=1 Tax=Ridgeia piscesae TaxID=27915 RepID=A0AAD9NKU4_RIDPI|nr:hypothetical protein NP493_1006g00008 [Ridgeia piscesae]
MVEYLISSSHELVCIFKDAHNQRSNLKTAKVTGKKVTVDKEGGTRGHERSRCDRKDEWKKGSESRCDQTKVNNKDDDRKKRDMKERNNRVRGRGKSQQPGRRKTEELF